VTRTVLLAGALGGVLGAVVSFALSRSLSPAPRGGETGAPAPAAGAQAPPEARQFADDFVAKMKAGKDDEVVAMLRRAFLELSDEQFSNAVRAPFLAARASKPYGPSLGVELVRERAVAPDAVRFAYLERFARGCAVWVIDCYHSPDGWQLAGFRHLKLEAAFELLR
jgi:hypothetical protein